MSSISHTLRIVSMPWWNLMKQCLIYQVQWFRRWIFHTGLFLTNLVVLTGCLCWCTHLISATICCEMHWGAFMRLKNKFVYHLITEEVCQKGLFTRLFIHDTAPDCRAGSCLLAESVHWCLNDFLYKLREAVLSCNACCLDPRRRFLRCSHVAEVYSSDAVTMVQPWDSLGQSSMVSISRHCRLTQHPLKASEIHLAFLKSTILAATYWLAWVERSRFPKFLQHVIVCGISWSLIFAGIKSKQYWSQTIHGKRHTLNSPRIYQTTRTLHKATTLQMAERLANG